MEFDYLCGQEVSPPGALPDGFVTHSFGGRYGRFATKGHISTMPDVLGEIFGQWMRRPEFQHRDGPTVEYYSPAFDGATGEGGFEIWVAIA